MSQINKYEITILWNDKQEKHIVNALTAQDAITQFKVKMDNVKPCNIIDIKPYEEVLTGEQIIRMNQLSERIRQEKQSEKKLNRILYGLLRFRR
jgi:hypothetical protein